MRSHVEECFESRPVSPVDIDFGGSWLREGENKRSNGQGCLSRVRTVDVLLREWDAAWRSVDQQESKSGAHSTADLSRPEAPGVASRGRLDRLGPSPRLPTDRLHEKLEYPVQVGNRVRTSSRSPRPGFALEYTLGCVSCGV